MHQASYNELYQDGGIEVSDIKYKFAAPGTTVISFRLTKNGAPFSGKLADNLNIYFVPWDGTNFQFADGSGRLSLKGKITYDGATGTTVSSTGEELAREMNQYSEGCSVSVSPV